jgi:hypothetical protein
MKHSKKPVFKPALAFESGQLKFCMALIAEQQRLLTLVKSVLPAELAAHALHCVVSGQRLLIYTEAASWASQIRFFHQVILNKLLASGQRNLSNLQVKVSPPAASSEPRKLKRLPSAETVRETFAQFDEESHDDLNAALSRLGKTLRKRTQVKSS